MLSITTRNGLTMNITLIQVSDDKDPTDWCYSSLFQEWWYLAHQPLVGKALLAIVSMCYTRSHRSCSLQGRAIPSRTEVGIGKIRNELGFNQIQMPTRTFLLSSTWYQLYTDYRSFLIDRWPISYRCWTKPTSDSLDRSGQRLYFSSLYLNRTYLRNGPASS